MTCRVLEIARQPYYCCLAQSVTDTELEQAYCANALFDAHRDDPEFGCRFLVDKARKQRRGGLPHRHGRGLTRWCGPRVR